MFDLSLQRIKALIKKEFIQLKRDKITLKMIILLPIFQLILFGYAINTDPKHLPAAIISRDNTFLTRSIVTALENSDYFRITRKISSDKEGNELLRQGKTLFVITIPDNFTHDVIKKRKPNILLQADASDPTSVSGAISSLNKIIDNVVEKEFTGALRNLKNTSSAFSIITHKSYNPEGFTRYNIVPGLIGMVLIFTGVMMTALALTREKERGTMENLLSMPVQPLEVMIGKITPFVFIGLFQAFIILSIARLLFNIPVLGNLGLLLFCSFIFIICNLSLGFLISTAAKNQTQALQMSVFVLLPSLMLTGFMFPFQGMPLWAQTIGKCIPLTYFLRITRGITLKGADFIDILPHLWPLLILMTAIIALTMKAYKNTLD